MCPGGWRFPSVDSQDGEETQFYVRQPLVSLVKLTSQTTQPWLYAKELNTSRSSTFTSHHLYISIAQQLQNMALYRESRNGLEMATLLNTVQRDSSMCDMRVGIFSSNV